MLHILDICVLVEYEAKSMVVLYALKSITIALR